MASTDEDAFLAGQLRKMQIVLIALLAGCVIFGLVALIMRGGFAPAAAQPMMSYVLLAVAVMQLVPLIVIRQLMVRYGRAKVARNEWPPLSQLPQQNLSERAKLSMLYQTRLIITGAFFEGGTFALIIGFLINGPWWTLIAALVFLLLLALQFPTRTRVERWLDEQQELLQQERMAI
jgi:hypothetical protein